MRQTDLMQIAAKMKIGQAYTLTKEDMLGCAEGMLKSGFDGPPRMCDIDEFITKASPNWGVKFQPNLFLHTWTMHKIKNI